MDTEVAVKSEPIWLEEDEEVLPRMMTESVPVPITFPHVKRESITWDINHVDAKNKTVLSANVCDEGNGILKSDIDIEEKCLLGDISESNYSAEGINSEVTFKLDSMWQIEDEETSQGHTKDEGIVSAADCDKLNEEFKTEIDIEENCILGDNSEFIQYCKGAGDANVLENEGIIISSTDELQAVQGYMIEYEEQINGNVDKEQERTISTTKYSRKVPKSFSKCAVTSDSNIVKHINSHNVGEPFKCEVCDKCFTQAGSLKIHMRLHTGEKPFICKECCKGFTQCGSLRDHMRVHTGEKPFKCKECSKCFTQSSHYNRHVRTHTGEKPFKCKECSKCFTESGNLKNHIRVHTGENLFECRECSKSFTKSCHFKRHVSTHTGERPFKCKECSKCFTESGHLKHHMRTHTGDKPFKCNVCSKCWTSSSNLKKHMRLHTGEKPFKCKECSKCFTQSSHLKQHVRTHT